MRTRGFTLLEIMVVVAIIGILSAMSIATMEEGRGRTAPRNAAADLSSAISVAKGRALERGSDVWLIIYPNGSETSASTVGNGSWFLYDDGDVNFGNTGSTDCTGAAGTTCNYETFSPPAKIYAPPSTLDFLVDQQYFDRAAKKNVKFGNASDTAVKWGEPFGTASTGLNAIATKDCTFCSGTGAARRGAIIFNGDGAARFVDGSGSPQFVTAGGLSLEGVKTQKQVTLFAIAGATGYVGVFQ